MIRPLAVSLLFLPLALCAQSTWVPYTATLQETIETIDAQGHSLATEVIATRTRQRWADGSELTRMTDPKAGSSNQVLRIAATRTIYLLDDISKRAVVHGPLLADRPHPDYSRMSKGSDRVIHGVTCTTYNSPTAGSVCDAVADGIVVQSQAEVVARGRVRKIWRLELTNVRVGVEPPLAELQLPTGYQVVSSTVAR